MLTTWGMDQKHQWHIRACQKCRMLPPPPTLLIQNLLHNKTPPPNRTDSMLAFISS